MSSILPTSSIEQLKPSTEGMKIPGWAREPLLHFMVLGALLFAFFDALQLRLQQAGDALLPYQMYLMLPYVLSIVALVLVARKASYPQALMKPYRKGER